MAASAAGSTLFLDEIEALDLECQATILRFIDQKEIKPHGSNITERIDIRFIVATNRDLGEMVSAGQFREDLHSRLAGVVIEIPLLRDRGADEIEKLARHFYRAFRKENSGKKGYKDVRVQDSVWSELARYPHSWPGNVRELKQVVETTLLETDSRPIRLEDFVRHITAREDAVTMGETTSDRLATLTDREKRIMSLIGEKGSLYRSEVESDLGLKATVAWGLLKGLMEKGLISREGTGRNTKYCLSR